MGWFSIPLELFFLSRFWAAFWLDNYSRIFASDLKISGGQLAASILSQQIPQMTSPVPDCATPFFFQVKTLRLCRVLPTFAHQPGAPVFFVGEIWFNFEDLWEVAPHEKKGGRYINVIRGVFIVTFFAFSSNLFWTIYFLDVSNIC